MKILLILRLNQVLQFYNFLIFVYVVNLFIDELFPNEKIQDKTQRKVTVDSTIKEDETQNQRKMILDTITEELQSQTQNPNEDCISANDNNNINSEKNFKHARIIFDSNEQPKKTSIMSRLGKRRLSADSAFAPQMVNHNRKTSPLNKLESKRSKSSFTNKNKSDKDRVLQFEKPREVISL